MAHLPPGRREAAGWPWAAVPALGLAVQPLSAPGRDKGRADGRARPQPQPQPQLPEGDWRHHPGAEKPVRQVPESGGKRAAAEDASSAAGRGKAGSHWREARAGGAAANWTRFPGPRASPVRHEALAPQPRLGPRGEATTARCAASARRGAHPTDVPAGAGERQVRRGAAPQCPTGPLAAPQRADSQDRGCGGAAVRALGLRSPPRWDLSGGPGSLPSLRDGEAPLAGQAAPRRRPWGFHLRGGEGTRRWRLDRLGLPRTCPGVSLEGQASKDLRVLGECRRLPCRVRRPSGSLPGRVLLGPP